MENIFSKPIDYAYKSKPSEFKNFNTFQVDVSGQCWQIIDFDSISQMVECSDRNVSNKVYISSKGLNGCSSKWQFGTIFSNEQKTRNCLLSGSIPDGLLKLAEEEKEKLLNAFPELLDLQQYAFKKRRTRVFAEEGGELDIDKFMSSQPEMWQKNVKKKNKRAMRVAFNGAMLGDAKEENFIKNMVTAAAMVDIFTGFGIAVEFIYSAISREVTTGTDGVAISAIVKGADEPLDISRLLACCAPGLFRYYVFTNRYAIGAGVMDESGGVSTYDMPDFYKEIKSIDVSISAKDTQKNIVDIFTTHLKSINL